MVAAAAHCRGQPRDGGDRGVIGDRDALGGRIGRDREDARTTFRRQLRRASPWRDAPAAAALALYGEEACERVPEDAEHKEPDADEHEYVAAPVLDSGCGGTEPLHESFLADGDTERRSEQQQDQHERGDGEGRDGCGEPAGSGRLPGQTGQDGSRSVEPGGDVAEAEQRGPSDGVLAAEPCLLLERTVDGGFELLSVRVVEYTLEDPGRPDTPERYRLITTIMDPEQAPADELAALYAERWEIETALDELKTHQRGPKVVLRSKTSDGVLQ